MLTKCTDYKVGDVVCLCSFYPNEMYRYIGIYANCHCFVPFDINTFYGSWDDDSCIEKGVPKNTVPFREKPFAFLII